MWGRLLKSQPFNSFNPDQQIAFAFVLNRTYRSKFTADPGVEQQIKAFPGAGRSRGSGA
jgi:hypothetical protein